MYFKYSHLFYVKYINFSYGRTNFNFTFCNGIEINVIIKIKKLKPSLCVFMCMYIMYLKNIDIY